MMVGNKKTLLTLPLLKLPLETIRQHYEDIAKEIPLRLAWKV